MSLNLRYSYTLAYEVLSTLSAEIKEALTALSVRPLLQLEIRFLSVAL